MTRLRLSPHFVIEEFDSHDGARVPKHLEPSVRLLCDYWLEPIRARFGPVKVTSGYRSFRQNERVGGAKGSIHLLSTRLPGRPEGRWVAAAADITCAKTSNDVLGSWCTWWTSRAPGLASFDRGGVGRYPGFVHVDTWRRRDW